MNKSTTEAYCYYERDLNNNYASYYCNISTLDKFNITQFISFLKKYKK